MPNEAEQELIAGVMTSDWLGCGLLGRGCDWLTVEQGGQRQEQGNTVWVTEQRKPGPRLITTLGNFTQKLTRFSNISLVFWVDMSWDGWLFQQRKKVEFGTHFFSWCHNVLHIRRKRVCVSDNENPSVSWRNFLDKDKMKNTFLLYNHTIFY